VIIDAVPGVDYDPILATENVGIIDIRSVYDLDGADVAPGGYASLIDPVQTTADERPARFVRIEKAVGIPDDEVRDFRGTAFGAAGGLGMREILGYAPVEPDGSVRIKVPAGVPFAIGVLDVKRAPPQPASSQLAASARRAKCSPAMAAISRRMHRPAACPPFHTAGAISSSRSTRARRRRASPSRTRTRRSSRTRARRWPKRARASPARRIALRSSPRWTCSTTTCGPIRSRRAVRLMLRFRIATPT
jgi:hypothetical protein